MGNSQPVFASHGLSVGGSNFVGRENQHLKLRLFDGKVFIKAIYFNYKDHFMEKINIGDKVDVAYVLKRNNFNGRIYIDMILRDIKKK